MASTTTYNASMQNGSYTLDLNEGGSMGEVTPYEAAPYEGGLGSNSGSLFYDSSLPPDVAEGRYYGFDTGMYDAEAFAAEGDLAEMGGAEFGLGALAEGAAEGAAFTLGGEVAVPAALLAVAGAYLLQGTADPQIVPGSYNFPAGWTRNCSVSPTPGGPYYKLGWNAPLNHPCYGNWGVSGFPCGVGGNGTANGPFGCPIPAGTISVNFITHTYPFDRTTIQGRAGYIWETWSYTSGPASPTLVPYNGVPAPFSPFDVSAPPHSVNDPLTSREPRRKQVAFPWGDPFGRSPSPDHGVRGWPRNAGHPGPGPEPGVPPFPQNDPSSPPVTYKTPANETSASPGKDFLPWRESYHLEVPDYSKKVRGPHDLFKAAGLFGREGMDVNKFLYQLSKSIPGHPCVGLRGHSMAACVLKHWKDINWKHAAGQMARQGEKAVERELGILAGRVKSYNPTLKERWKGFEASGRLLPEEKKALKKAFRVAKDIHSAVNLGLKRSRAMRGMF